MFRYIQDLDLLIPYLPRLWELTMVDHIIIMEPIMEETMEHIMEENIMEHIMEHIMEENIHELLMWLVRFHHDGPHPCRLVACPVFVARV